MLFFFFNDTATTEIYTLSLHDALPICPGRLVAEADADTRDDSARRGALLQDRGRAVSHVGAGRVPGRADRKSTRLNSSHANISYAVFCLKKKKTTELQSSHHTICRLHL